MHSSYNNNYYGKNIMASMHHIRAYHIKPALSVQSVRFVIEKCDYTFLLAFKKALSTLTFPSVLTRL